MEHLGVFTLIVGFLSLALIMNRNTVALTGCMEQMRKETNDRFEAIRTEMNQFRTEMNRRFDEATTERNRRFDTISHDIADLRERMARVEETLKTGDPRNQNAA